MYTRAHPLTCTHLLTLIPHPRRKVERSNLLNMLKIAIKALIESSMRLGAGLKDDHAHLVQFLVLMELLMKHRLKSEWAWLECELAYSLCMTND